jgi:nucleotide-binding universal stress UspA family protein
MSLAKIVVGVDHSDRSDKAVRRANRIALYHDAHLIIEYALDVGSAQRLRGLLERVAVEETEERVVALLGEEAASFEVKADAGRPFEAVRDRCKVSDADLIVIGAHRLDSTPTGLSGATARRLINVAPAPVLVVVDEPKGPYENVLVGYDDSHAAREALKAALVIAPGAKLTIVTACLVPFSARHVENELVSQFVDDTRRMVTEALREQSISQDNLEIVVRAGEALGVILDVQRERQPDLLALGTSMPQLYRQIFGGGIVDLIAANPPCDLLVAKT